MDLPTGGSVPPTIVLSPSEGGELIQNLTQPVGAPLSALLAGEKTPASTMGMSNPVVQRRLGFGSPEAKAEVVALAATITKEPLLAKHANEVAEMLHGEGER